MRVAAIAVLLLLPALGIADEFPARVVGVSDGDTLTVLAAGNRQVKVRLYGVDAPESRQDFGDRAKQATANMAFGRMVVVHSHGTDRYGRVVADIRLPSGKSLGAELVQGGWAWWYREYAPGDRLLASLEASARETHRGIWAHANPIPPWEWRKGGATPITAGVVGNRNSWLYHRPGCRGALSMKPANRIEFRSAAEAERAGYRKAGDCR